MKCWCGNEVDENGKHLTLNPNSLSGSHMRKNGDKIEHLQGNGRAPDAPAVEAEAPAAENGDALGG